MIKIGIIGMSPGNAHPYSWSGIINGYYDGDEISKVGYPGVTSYLDANQDTLGITTARVTHIWTQDRVISESIAGSGRIDVVCDAMEEMIGQVDAVILSRDDPENHVEMARPFINASIPLFIDKPLAINQEDLDFFIKSVNAGKLIMSTSSFRYSNECRTAKTMLKSLGKIELATAVGKKDWVKYGVHLLEGLFMILDDPRVVSVKHIGKEGKDIVHLDFEGGTQAVLQLFMDIVPTLQLSLYGNDGWQLIEVKNSYSMFRDNIIEFIRSVEDGKSRIDFDKTINIIRTLIAARESLEQGGKTIDLSLQTTYKIEK